MPKIYIEGKPYEVTPGQNLLHAALSLGFDVPYFCWHPALGSVGACRQCAVKQFRDENDTRGQIVMSCMTPATEGVRISIDDPEVRDFRASVIEWLMTNHPHDCPVCDEGGECHLQDMTVMSGHNYRRYRFRKRTFRNQYLGPFINHEMNRCITCYRCVRFYRDYAEGKDFDCFAAKNQIYFGRHQDGILENEFSGNLVEVCPTGVFTDRTLKNHYTRKWDLQAAPSVCQHCGLGCNTIAGERYGVLRRILNRYNGRVNGYFLCDRGRFGYEFVNHERRILEPVLRRNAGGTGEKVTRETALERLRLLFKNPGRLIGIGSPRAALEANFALRSLVGAENFYDGMASGESRLAGRILEILESGPARSPSLHEVQQADAVLVLGEDVTNTAPMLALALRRAARRQPEKAVISGLKIPGWNDVALREVIQRDRGPFYVATPADTKLDEVATKTYRGAPGEVARLGFAVAHELNSAAPGVEGLSEEVAGLAREIAAALKNAERPLIVSGASLGSEAVVEAAANAAWALCGDGRRAELCYTVPECNSFGLALLAGKNLEEAFQTADRGEVNTVVVLENDLYRRAVAERVDRFLGAAEHVIVLDFLENGTTSRADVVLPASTFAEGSGSVVNNEGRLQRYFKVFVPRGDVQESWRWIRDAAKLAGGEPGSWSTLDDVCDALLTEVADLRALAAVAPRADFRIEGLKIPRSTHRYSGRTAMNAARNVSEPKPPEDPDSPLAFSMEGYPGRQPSGLTTFFWAPAWNSVQSTAKYQNEVGGPLRGGDPGVRLFEPREDARAEFFHPVPAPSAAAPGEWLVVPLHHIFGSEELSVSSPGLAERVPKPYLALNPQDAESLGVREGETVRLTVDGRKRELPVALRPALPRGLAGFPVGLPGEPWIELPARAELRGK